jgi:hypothetical protein
MPGQPIIPNHDKILFYLVTILLVLSARHGKDLSIEGALRM